MIRKRLRFNPWVRKIPWRRKWLPTPVFLPQESHEQRSLVCFSPWGRRESDRTEATSHPQHRDLSISTKFSNTWESCSQYSFIILFISRESIVMFSLSCLKVVIYVFSSFSWLKWPEVYQCIDFYKAPSFESTDFLYYFPVFNCIGFCSNFCFSSAYFSLKLYLFFIVFLYRRLTDLVLCSCQIYAQEETEIDI